MKRLSRLGVAAVVAAASLTPIMASSPAQAADFGLDLKILNYEWTPRTGNLAVTAKVDCARQARSASWAVKVKQRTSAKAAQRISCTGDQQRLTLLLDSKNSRFHPGFATVQLTTMECISDFCVGVAYEPQKFRIPPPGQSGVPGAR